MLTRLGISNADQTKLAKAYSGGMKRRLCIAIGLVGSPSVLILDEPTAGVDVSGKREIWNLLNQLRAELHCSVLVTTHSLEEADQLADRIAIMDSGALVKVGFTSELKAEQNRVFLDVVCVGDAVSDQVKGGLEGGGVQLDTYHTDSTLRGRQLQLHTFAELLTTRLDVRVTAVLHGVVARFEVPMQTLPMSRLLQVADQLVAEGLIAAYSVQQLSLEDIFLLTVGATAPSEENL